MSAPTSDRGGMQQVIRAMRADGWEIDSAWDGEESLESPNETAAIDWVMACDQGHIYFRKGDETGWVFFVLGNEPEEVVNDYTVNLTAVDALTSSWY